MDTSADATDIPMPWAWESLFDDDSHSSSSDHDNDMTDMPDTNSLDHMHNYFGTTEELPPVFDDDDFLNSVLRNDYDTFTVGAASHSLVEEAMYMLDTTDMEMEPLEYYPSKLPVNLEQDEEDDITLLREVQEYLDALPAQLQKDRQGYRAYDNSASMARRSPASRVVMTIDLSVDSD